MNSYLYKSFIVFFCQVDYTVQIIFKLAMSRIGSTRLTSSAAADTSRSIIMSMILARWWSTSEGSYFNNCLNWSLNYQLGACSEVLAENTRFIFASPTHFDTFFPSLQKKKKKVVSLQYVWDQMVWLKCGWWATSPQLSYDSLTPVKRDSYN